MTKTTEFNEAAVRRMRDRVYEQPSSDVNWEACKNYWLSEQNVRWLEAECDRMDMRERRRVEE